MLRNEFFKYKMIRYKLARYTLSNLCLCSLYSCVLLSVLSVLSAPVVHASPRCADLISSSSSREQSVPTSKEQSVHTNFEFGSESTSRGKNVLPLSGSSPKNALGSSAASGTLGSSSMSALDFFANSKPPKEGTKNFQSYIGELLEKQIIGDPQLIRFIEHLEKGELINPISKDEALMSTALHIQHRGLQQYLDKSSLNQKEILDWSRATLEKRARVRVSREETREETQSIYQRLEFYSVKRPVHFETRDKGGKKLPVSLTYPIEVQSTPVTQNQWVEIMGENPSRFSKGEYTVVLDFHGKLIELQPDNPVENVTLWSVFEFANRLSEQHGLPPAYDLSGINWKSGTKPENGTLSSKGMGVDALRIYVKGKSHDPSEGDIYYQAEGYRLPTLAEQMYMLRGGEQMKDDSFFKDEADLAQYAWYEGNSDEKPHPVGLLQAMVIDGREFYDLYGNVREWGWDHKADELESYSGYSSSGYGMPLYSACFWVELIITIQFFHRQVVSRC